ncbi:hypothetical protein AAMO2058_001224500 [Amorphochlora amoebiformis]
MGLHGKDLLGATTILAVALLVAGWRISYLYGKEEAIRELEAKAAFESFSTYAGAPPGDGPRRFAVGLNACLDLIVPAIEVFDVVGADGSDIVARDHETIGTLEELQEVFKYFFQKGGAGERTVRDADVFRSIVSAARGVEEQKIFVGGNAALMGLTIKDKELYLSKDRKGKSKQTVDVLMGGGVGPKLKTMLESRMTFSKDAILNEDDYHVILEYPMGATWGGVTSPRANRFIISHDLTNAKMRTLEAFEDSAAQFKPDVIVLSGLHMMEGEDPAFRSSRIEDFVKMLNTFPTTTPIHLELASMANEKYVSEIVQKVFPYVDSIGLNEQELELISRASNGPHHTMVDDDSIADTAKVGETLNWVLKTFAGPENNSRLSRIHFHSLTFHVIAHLEHIWSNSKKAVVAGSWACSTRACANETLAYDDVTLRLPQKFGISSQYPNLELDLLEAHQQSAVGWTRGDINFFLSPVYVCNTPRKTVGLGDTISANGLFYSKFGPVGV